MWTVFKSNGSIHFELMNNTLFSLLSVKKHRK